MMAGAHDVFLPLIGLHIWQLVRSILQTLVRLVIQATDLRHAGGTCMIAEFSQLTAWFVDYCDAAQAMDSRSLVPGCGSMSLLVHAIIPVAQILRCGSSSLL